MKIKCRGKIFDVYDLPEALKIGIKPVKNWRKAKAGDWICTSDDKVVQVIRTREEHPKGKKKSYYFIRTGYGEYPAHRSKIYSGQQPDYRRDTRYSGKELIKNVRPTTLQKAFVDNLYMSEQINDDGMWDAEAVINAYQAIYSDNNPEQALRRGMGILKKKHIKEYISMNMRDKLIETGVDDDFVAQSYKDLIVKQDTPHATRLNALNRVSDLLGHMTKEKKEESVEGIFALSDGDIKKLASVRQKFAETNYVLEDLGNEKTHHKN
jgi:hypothetical protein